MSTGETEHMQNSAMQDAQAGQGTQDAQNKQVQRSSYVTPLGEHDPSTVAAFWQRFLADTGRPSDMAAPEPWAFGDTVELSTTLIGLVLHGPKRATASVVAEYELADEPLPAVGDLSIVLDETMNPVAVLEITDLRVGPLSSVDAAFAWDEGEDDRTVESWLDAHTWAFTRAYERLGLEFHPDIAVVFERFDLIYSS